MNKSCTPMATQSLPTNNTWKQVIKQAVRQSVPFLATVTLLFPFAASADPSLSTSYNSESASGDFSNYQNTTNDNVGALTDSQQSQGAGTSESISIFAS